MKRHLPILTVLLLSFVAIAPGQNPAPPDWSAPAAQTAMQKWLADLDAQWQAAFKREVSDPYTAENDRLRAQYVAALEAGITKASGAVDLNAAVVWRNEQKRFAEANGLPAQDDAADPLPVKQLRAAWRSQLPRIETERATRAKAMHAKYDLVLAQAQAQLTKGARIDDALLVKSKRDEVAAAWLAGIPATPPSTVAVGQPKPPSAAVPFGSAKGLKDQIRILPYVQELGTVKFAPHDNRVPDELQVVVKDQQFQIVGSKKGTERRILDRNTGHHGKVVLISAKAPQSGTLSAKVQTRYYIAFELPNSTLKTKEIEVKPDTAYEWSLKTTENTLVFSVNKQGQPAEKGRELEHVESRGSEVKSFGFAATVRAPQDAADLTVIVIPAQK